MSPALAFDVSTDGIACVMTFKQLTQEQWEDLRAIRDDWPNGIDWSEFRREPEARGRTYWSSHEVRDAFGVPSTMRKRMERFCGNIANCRMD
jgi:hypothetical protein